MLNKRFRRFVRRLHLSFDAFVGNWFFRASSLQELSKIPHELLTMDRFTDYGFSKKHHFSEFRVLAQHAKQSPATCDLKVYQDSLVYTYILDNFPPGARLLEIGGGESRIIDALKGTYEVWNLDKLEGSGFGPKALLKTEGFRLVKDYIGSFSKDLPNAYFDFVFSISTLEHIPKSPSFVESAIFDIQRLIKPEGTSLHCVDAFLYSDHFFVHPFIKRVHDLGLVSQKETCFNDIIGDGNLWRLSAYAFYTRWFHLVRKPLKTFGYPFSINLLWHR